MRAAALLLAPREDADELTRTGGVLGVTVCCLASVDEVLRLEVVCEFRSNCAENDAVQRIRILYAKNLGRSTLVPSQSHMTYPLSFARPFPRSDIFTQMFNSCQCSCRSLGTSLSLFDQSRFVDPKSRDGGSARPADETTLGTLLHGLRVRKGLDRTLIFPSRRSGETRREFVNVALCC